MEIGTVLITGGTDGIGRETALQLARMGANVLVHGRDTEKGTRVLDAIKNEIRNATVNLYTADFSSLADVKRMAEEIIQEQKNKCFSEQCRKFL